MGREALFLSNIDVSWRRKFQISLIFSSIYSYPYYTVNIISADCIIVCLPLRLCSQFYSYVNELLTFLRLRIHPKFLTT